MLNTHAEVEWRSVAARPTGGTTVVVHDGSTFSDTRWIKFWPDFWNGRGIG